MNDAAQIIIVGLVVAAAGFFLLRLTIKHLRGDCGCGCGSSRPRPKRTDLTIDGKRQR